ncbi:hypothetical protein ACA910_006458 [Epithemia clementina (nom. ined.)]
MLNKEASLMLQESFIAREDVAPMYGTKMPFFDNLKEDQNELEEDLDNECCDNSSVKLGNPNHQSETDHAVIDKANDILTFEDEDIEAGIEVSTDKRMTANLFMQSMKEEM